MERVSSTVECLATSLASTYLIPAKISPFIAKWPLGRHCKITTFWEPTVIGQNQNRLILYLVSTSYFQKGWLMSPLSIFRPVPIIKDHSNCSISEIINSNILFCKLPSLSSYISSLYFWAFIQPAWVYDQVPSVWQALSSSTIPFGAWNIVDG